VGFKNEIETYIMVKATVIMGLVKDKISNDWVPTRMKGLINTDTWIFTPDASFPGLPQIAFIREVNFKRAENNAKTNEI
jgi:hypothetical protein